MDEFNNIDAPFTDIGEYDTLRANGSIVSVYDEKAMRAAGLVVSETFASTIPNRSAIRRITAVDDAVCVQVYCGLTNQTKLIRLQTGN